MAATGGANNYLEIYCSTEVSYIQSNSDIQVFKLTRLIYLDLCTTVRCRMLKVEFSKQA